MIIKYQAFLIYLFFPICVFSQQLYLSMQGIVEKNNIYVSDDQGYCLNVDYNIYKAFYSRLAVTQYSAKLTTHHKREYPFNGDFTSYSIDLGFFGGSKLYFIEPHIGLGLEYSINMRSIDKSTESDLYSIGYSNIEEKIQNAFSPYFHLGVKTVVYKNIFYLVEVKYTLLRIISNRNYKLLSNSEVLNVDSKYYIYHLFYGIGFGLEL